MTPDFYIGETWLIPGKARDYQGQPLKLTGATIYFRLFTSTGVLADLTNDDGIQILDELTGDYLVTVSPERQTAWDLSLTVVRYQVQIVLGNGVVSVQNNGHFKVEASSFARFPVGA